MTLTVPGAEGEISLQAAAVELSYFDGCPLVRSDNAPADMVRNFAGFRETLEYDYGMKVGIHADWLAPGEEIPTASREILMGRSNRPESEAADGLREGDYLIRLENDRLLIAAGPLRRRMRRRMRFSPCSWIGTPESSICPWGKDTGSKSGTRVTGCPWTGSG